MTLERAHEILDLQKRGITQLPQKVVYALFVTGDLGDHEGLRSQRVDPAVQEVQPNPWTQRSTQMVASDNVRLGTQTWARGGL